MLRQARRLGRVATCRYGRSRHRCATTWSSPPNEKRHEPLRILFCGADEFSIFSLIALRRLQRECQDKIGSIHVVCRPDKRVGRGLKRIQQVPIKAVTQELALELSQVDSFKDFKAPEPIDLVVAVSFGLLVPADLLRSATYGGLNVHPSLLPAFRGPAPIQRTLLAERRLTGVTLQTMHPTRFDHGMILSRTVMRFPPYKTPHGLINVLGPHGADLLINGLRDGIFIDPKPLKLPGHDELIPSYARKITSEDRHIDWTTWSAHQIGLRDRVLDNLWDTETYRRCCNWMKPQEEHQQLNKRVIFQGPWRVEQVPEWQRRNDFSTLKPGDPMLRDDRLSGRRIGIWTADGWIAYPNDIIVEGGRKTGGAEKLAQVMQEARDRKLEIRENASRARKARAEAKKLVPAKAASQHATSSGSNT